MSKKWLDAAVRYEMARLSDRNSCKKVRKPAELIPTLKRFLESDEWVKEAKKLLVASRSHIILGTKGSANFITMAVILDQSGLKKYARDKYRPFGIQEANRLLTQIHKNNPGFDPVLFIRQELDRIADNAP